MNTLVYWASGPLPVPCECSIKQYFREDSLFQQTIIIKMIAFISANFQANYLGYWYYDL